MADEKERTIGRSFRIKEKWLNTLIQEANREGISPNALLNKILEDYSNYYRHFVRHSSMIVSKYTFSTIIEKFPKDDLEEFADKTASMVTKDLFPTLGLSYNYDNVILFISEVLGRYGNWFKFEHHQKNNKEIFHLRHTLGNNTTIFLARMLSKLFSALNKDVKIVTFEGSITLEVTTS